MHFPTHGAMVCYGFRHAGRNVRRGVYLLYSRRHSTNGSLRLHALAFQIPHGCRSTLYGARLLPPPLPLLPTTPLAPGALHYGAHMAWRGRQRIVAGSVDGGVVEGSLDLSTQPVRSHTMPHLAARRRVAPNSLLAPFSYTARLLKTCCVRKRGAWENGVNVGKVEKNGAVAGCGGINAIVAAWQAATGGMIIITSKHLLFSAADRRA